MDYLVFYKYDEECETLVTSARHIFNVMDMSDCYDVRIEALYALIGPNELRRCIFEGTWSNPKNPLLMVIRDAETGEAYEKGYGTDH